MLFLMPKRNKLNLSNRIVAKKTMIIRKYLVSRGWGRTIKDLSISVLSDNFNHLQPGSQFCGDTVKLEGSI